VIIAGFITTLAGVVILLALAWTRCSTTVLGLTKR
jgi:hypothetical protein